MAPRTHTDFILFPKYIHHFEEIKLILILPSHLYSRLNLATNDTFCSQYLNLETFIVCKSVYISITFFRVLCSSISSVVRGLSPIHVSPFCSALLPSLPKSCLCLQCPLCMRVENPPGLVESHAGQDKRRLGLRPLLFGYLWDDVGCL